MTKTTLMPMLSILKKSIVNPSSPTPFSLRTHKLSYIDQAISSMYMPFGYFYPSSQLINNNNNNNNISKCVQNSLSKLLSAYYPFAGLVRDNATVECNDNGAEFYDVRIHCPMSHVLDNMEQLQEAVFPRALPWSNTHNKLLVSHLCHFDCGGVAISVSLSHKIGDAYTIMKFVKDWADVMRDAINDPPNPYFVGDSIIRPPENSPPITYPVLEANVTELGKQRIYSFSDSQIKSLKAMVEAKTGIRNPTRVCMPAECAKNFMFLLGSKSRGGVDVSVTMDEDQLCAFDEQYQEMLVEELN